MQQMTLRAGDREGMCRRITTLSFRLKLEKYNVSNFAPKTNHQGGSHAPRYF
jgi:hypothetical protein